MITLSQEDIEKELGDLNTVLYRLNRADNAGVYVSDAIEIICDRIAKLEMLLNQ